MSSRVRLAAAMAASSEPTAAIPTFASSNGADRGRVDRREEERKRGQGDDLGHEQERDHAERLREPDGTAVARGHDEAVQQAFVPLGGERARQAEDGGEDDRDPEQTAGHDSLRVLGEVDGTTKWKTTSAETTNRSIAGTVSRARSSSSRSLRARTATSWRYITQGKPHGGERFEPFRLVGADGDGTGAGLLRQLGVEQRGALAVEARERLVQQEQPRLVQECAAKRKPLPHSLRVRGDSFVANLPQPVALEQHPDALLALAHPIQAAVQLEVLERGELLVDERLVADVADTLSSHRNLELSSGRRQQALRRTHERALAGPFAPVTSRKPPVGRSTSMPWSTVFSPKRRSRPRARIIIRGRPRARTRRTSG